MLLWLLIFIGLAGIPFGILLSYIARDELKSGYRYFKILEFIFLILIIFLVLYNLRQEYFYGLLDMIFAIFLVVSTMVKKILYKIIFTIISISGLIYFTSFFSEITLFLIMCFIFVLMLVTTATWKLKCYKKSL